MSQTVNRRVVLSGFALPAAAAAIGLGASPALAKSRQIPPIGTPESPGDLPGAGLPGLPSFSEGTHDAVLTEAAASALAAANVTFEPAAGSTTVEGETRPSTRMTLSVGSAGPDLLVGAVAFDGGFVLRGASRQLVFDSFTSQLAAKVATAWVAADDEPGQRIPAVTYDLSTSTITVDGTALVLESYGLFLTPEAVAKISEVFPGVSLTTEDQFAEGSARGTYTLPI